MQDLKRSSITVRLGEALLHALRVEAAKRPQTVNAEIVQRLEASLSRQREAASPKLVSVPTDMQLSPESLEWLGLWDDMDASQRRRALAVIKAVIDADAA